MNRKSSRARPVLVLGSVNIDHVVRVKRLPLAGETVLAADYSIRVGGKGRNQAVAIARLGGISILVAATGDDADGVAVRADVVAQGVDATHVVTVGDSPTGVALITVDEAGENSIVVYPGANARLREISPDVLAGGPAVLLCSLEVPLAVVAAAAAQARHAGLVTVVNAAPMLGVADGTLQAIIDHTDVLVVNESEGRDLTSMPTGDVDSLVRSLVSWRRASAPPVVLTVGARGAVIIGEQGALSVPAPAVTASDTVGAGDTFVGMLALALAAGFPIEEAARLACTAGAIAVSRPAELSAQAVDELRAQA